MVAEGQVAPDEVRFNDPPWKYAAGTPNILGVIVSAQALRLVLDLVAGQPHWFGTAEPLPREVVESAMARVGEHTRAVTERAHAALREIPGLTVYGPPPGVLRSPLLSFNVAGADPKALADELNRLGVESRAGCHCATLAHRELGLTPPASCRLSFALYTSADDVDRAGEALRRGVDRVRRGELTAPR
jgi:cysteine desulfurase/selenocysteine lyase